MINQKEGKRRLSAFSGLMWKNNSAQIKTTLMYLIIFCLFFYIAPASWAKDSKSKSETAAQFVVQDLRVDDIPNDDGSGLQVSWKPLGPEKRIIEYRVYRGANPENLYFVGSVPVNPQTGFPGERVNYYDNGYNMFVDISSPAKQRKEAQQDKDSPLYRNIPRDLNIIGPMLKDYSILGVIPKDAFYYKTKMVERKIDNETNFYAGLRLDQFQSLLKKLIPNKPYYYTVIAVNESRVYYPYADIVEGIPRINDPELIRNFHSVYVEDKDQLQFEWTLPLNTDLLRNNNIFLVHDKDLNAYHEFNDEHNLIVQNRIDRFNDPDIEEIKATKKNPGSLILSTPFTTENTVSLKVEGNSIVDEKNGINVSFDSDKVDNYHFVFQLEDWYGGTSYSNIAKLMVTSSEHLPTVPNFTVADKPDDQGDYMCVFWEKPVVFLTNSSFLNKDKTKLTINYDFETNRNYKVRNIYFDIYDDEGALITSVNEFHPDLLFNITLPKKYSPDSPEYDINRKIAFEIRMKTAGEEVPADYVLKQEMQYDEDYRTFQPLELYMNGEKIEKVQDYSYVVYKKPYTSETFRFSTRSAGVMRQADDIVRYETTVYKGVGEFDLDKNLLLVDTSINAYYDKETKTTVNTDIYLSVVEHKIEKYTKEIKDAEAKLATVEDENEKAQLQAQINRYQGYLDTNNNEYFQEANSITNNKKRMKFLSKRREDELRHFQYRMVKTDGHAGFVETDIFHDEEGNDYFIPISNWFNKERIPTLIASLLFGFLVWFMIRRAKKGHDMYIRPIAGLQEIDNAIGRATEMGRPILFQPGLSGIGDVATLAGLSILGKVATKAAEYDTKIIVPVRDYIVMPIAQEIVKDAHYEAGRPDTYDKSSVFFITTDQFAFVAGVNGVMLREKCATCFYMGMYYAEALLMTETGNSIGAVQIAGSDAVTQIPFFITTCDYTLIGEELYGASAYLARDPMMIGNLKAVDVTKAIILVFLIVGTALSTAKITFLINIFPDK
ncbi:MAG: DUF6754 domain-containing protein [Candidatus Cloacimonas sp.]|nr:hypothetical protein [Candidatus Cloacimonadota bacterium]